MEKNNVKRCPKCNEKLEWLGGKCLQCKEQNPMDNKERINFLKDRLEFRHKMFMEWLFVDKTIIEDYAKFAERTKEIETEVNKLIKQDAILGADE